MLAVSLRRNRMMAKRFKPMVAPRRYVFTQGSLSESKSSNGSLHHKPPWTGVQEHEETWGFPLESEYQDLAADVKLGSPSP